MRASELLTIGICLSNPQLVTAATALPGIFNDILHGLGLDKRGDSGEGDSTPPTPTWTVPASGTGSSYALACNNEFAAYNTLLSYGITPTGTTLVRTCRLSTDFRGPVTTLCDGRTRILGSLTPASSGTYCYNDFPPTYPYTGPAPSCSIGPSDCKWLHQWYLTASASNTVASASWNPPNQPVCTIDGTYAPECGQCTIHGGSVQLLYFPVTDKPSRDMCATMPPAPTMCPFGSTLSNNDTLFGLNTAPCPYVEIPPWKTSESGPSTVINGTTLFSNRAYISYETLYATNSCGQVGNAYANGLVTVASSDLYSLSGYHFGQTHAAYSFNFADLIPPIPASAYLCQWNCADSDGNLGLFTDGDMVNGEPLGRLGFCRTIIDEAYRPVLAVPPQMRGIDPKWKQCLLGLDGLYDPPKALIQQTSVDAVSLPSWETGKPQPGGTLTTDPPAVTTPPSVPTYDSSASVTVIHTTVVTVSGKGASGANASSSKQGTANSSWPSAGLYIAACFFLIVCIR